MHFDKVCGVMLYGDVLEPLNPAQSSTVLTACVRSEICPEGEICDLHCAYVQRVVTPEQWHKFSELGWPNLDRKYDIIGVLELDCMN